MKKSLLIFLAIFAISVGMNSFEAHAQTAGNPNPAPLPDWTLVGEVTVQLEYGITFTAYSYIDNSGQYQSATAVGGESYR